MKSDTAGLLYNNAIYELNNYPYQLFGMKEKIKSLYRTLRYKQKSDHCSWANALIAKGFWDLYNVTKKEDYFFIVKDYCNRVLCSKNDNLIVDDVLNAYLMECVLSVEKNVTYERYTDQVYMFIEQAPRDICESILYRPNVSDIIIIDSLGMICPFLFRYADRKHNTNAKKSAEIQICNYLKYGMDMETKLPYHGYSLKNNIKVGIIGWGRAVGWLMVTLADSFNYIKENEELVDFTRQFVENVKQYIRADGSFSWQLVAKEGFGDSSATAMIGYGLSILDNNCNVILEQINNYLINGIKNGKDTNCSGESGGYGVYSQNYGSFPWGTGSILSFCSRYQ